MFPETRFRRSQNRSFVGSLGTNNARIESESQRKQSRGESSTNSEIEKESIRPSQFTSLDRGMTIVEHQGTGRPSQAQFSLVPTLEFEGSLTIIRDVIAPVQIFAFPIILWAALSLGFAANSLLALNLTQSQVFAAPPYNFSSAAVGFVNFAFVVGGIIGLLTAGPVSDWVSMKATMRNKGIREAEMRLVALVPYIAINLVGMTVRFQVR